LEDLKRVVEDTEKFLQIPDVSLTEIQDRVNNLSDILSAFASTYNTTLESNRDDFNALVTRVQEVANELDVKVTEVSTALSDLHSLSDEEIAQLQESVNTLKSVTESLDVTILETIDLVADEVNAMKRTAFFNITVDSADGTKQIDVTSFGFEDTNYAVMANIENDWMVQPIIKDKTKDSFKVALVDRRHFADYEIYKDCSGDGDAVSVNIMIAFNPKTLISKVVNTENSSVTVGN